ncbi:hypothetical protein AVEN_235255-1 [Araneus ventricosus]|uniref:Uncharacterized protein n=1 Tax=Araneus ventricosus TaxID=182803 RepID=A0A4Y2A5P0_ARAVE|nr:hypothetical protein AVEN_235255-1 [Araneus ventricosus]
MHVNHSPDLAPSDFHLFGPLKKHLAGNHFRTDTKFRKLSLSGSATWTLISSMPVSIDWCTDSTNAMVTMCKSNIYQCLSTFVCLFDFVNKPFLRGLVALLFEL